MTEENVRDLKMVGTTTSAGGRFRNVKLTGESVFSGDVDCFKLANTGEFIVNGSLRAIELKITGECKVQGSLQALSARGRGELMVSSGVRGENIKFTGSIEVGVDCEAGTLEVDGAINVAGLLSADWLELNMYGPCRAREIGGTTLLVKRSKATKLLNLLKSSGQAKLTADQIEGDKVELDHTEAGVVRGNNVKIGPGCEIGRVEYRDTLEVHKSSVVKESIRQ
ncbi:bactofilin [Cohnella luojiensis]|uniref:Bactofilin n=1 Tax=Cohnella luojiensis TaxID=652876 RepID=A0A4Y8LS44_9BACL|nr:bactofilin [Cohnella luojiensis]TFE24298.1 bactofilin [Cohnella luojiensis]